MVSAQSFRVCRGVASKFTRFAGPWANHDERELFPGCSPTMREAAAITNTERTTSAHAILLVSAVASGKRLTDRRRQTRSLANSLHFHQRKRPAHERNHLSAEDAYGLAFSEQVYRH